MADFSLSFHEDDSFCLDHDNRKFLSKNIDPSKINENIFYEGNIPLPELYKKVFQKSYEEFIQKQIESGHANRVKDYPKTYYEFVVQKQQEAEKKLQEEKTKLAHKKDLRGKQSFTKVAKQIIVQIGNVDDFSQMDQAAQSELSDRMAQALTEYMRTFQQENPTLVICNAVIHRDEMSLAPHLHLTYVPVAESSRGQKIVNSQTKAINALGFFADKQKREDGEYETEQTKWQTKERDRMVSIAERFGLSVGYTRGNRGKGQTLDEYRATMDAVRQAKAKAVEAEALAVEADAQEKLSVHNNATIEKQNTEIAVQSQTIDKNNMRIVAQSEKISKTAEKLHDTKNRLQVSEQTLQEVCEEISEKTAELEAVAKKIEKANGLNEALERAEAEIEKQILAPFPPPHKYTEEKKGVFKKGKRKIYQVPEEDYERMRMYSNLSNQTLKLKIANLLEPIKDLLEEMPFFRRLSVIIANLQKHLGHCEDVIASQKNEIRQLKEENAIMQQTLRNKGIDPQKLMQKELGRTIKERDLADTILDDEFDR